MSPFANALSDADVFWSKVDRTGECWLWNGATDPHGYGRLVVDQEVMTANHVAWFLVMGRWPDDRLYRKCPGTLDRRCVRPHHMREGAPHRAISRWSGAAQSGFPPEFRAASGAFMPTEQAQDDLMPTLLYRGNLTSGRAQALFNFTILAQKAEARRLGDVVELSKNWPDASHAVGLHKPISTPSTAAQFWGRVLAHPDITANRPGMREYMQETLHASGWKPVRLDPIDRYSPWSARRWRSGRRSMEEVRATAATRREARAIAAAAAAEPMTEVWPFVQSGFNDEHDLVAAVDAAVPKSLPEVVRQDVCQDLILAVLEDRLRVSELSAASGEYTKRVFAQYPRKYGALSLDAPAPWSDDGRSLMDTLADAPVILDGGFGSLRDLRDQLLREEVVA